MSDAKDRREGGFDYARPIGNNPVEWQDNARKTELYQRGDMVMVWVNEADLHPLRDKSIALRARDGGMG